MRILIRTSRLAIWARRLGSFALPLVIIPIFLHRAEIIDSETFALIEVIGFSIAAGALLSGLGAFVRLWYTGDKGWGRAVAGVLLGTICLAPLIYVLIETQRYPHITDVGTLPGRNMELVMFKPAPDVPLPPQAELVAAFPGMMARDYPLGVNTVYRLAEDLVKKSGWTIIRTEPPQLESARGQINATEMTLFGWQDEIAIEVRGDFTHAVVSMRSASLASSHDLGRNGRRIENFLVALDEVVTETIRTAPPIDSPPVPATQSSDD